MKFRIHYTSPKVRGALTVEIGAENKGVALATFAHNYPGSKVSRVEPLGGAVTRATAPAPVVTLTPEDQPLSEEQRESCIGQLQQLRQRLRAMPRPESQPGVVTRSFENRA